MLGDPIFGCLLEDVGDKDGAATFYSRDDRIPISADGLLSALPVDVVRATSFEFHRDFLNKKPIIFPDYASEWFGREEQRLGAIFRSINQNDTVQVLIAKDGKNFLRHELCEVCNSKLGEAICDIFDVSYLDYDGSIASDDLTNRDPTCEKARKYLRIYFGDYAQLAKHVDFTFLSALAFPELAKTSKKVENDSDRLIKISGFEAKNIGLWFSVAGCLTPLHFDLCHGFLAQIMGRKTFILASSDDPVLRRYWEKARGPGGSSEYSRNSSTNPIDLNKWLEGDSYVREKFPLLDEVTWFIAALEPGDILYTPPGWWHYVISDTNSVSLLVPFDPLPERDTLPMNVLLL